jgi:hypothetical protein
MLARRSRNRTRNGGSVVLLTLVALVALVGIVGLAVDASHLGYVKSRLQSTVDAMSLAAARRLDETGSTLEACNAAREVMLANTAQFTELADALPAGTSCPENTWFALQFAATAYPFVPGSSPARYVRIRISDVGSETSLARVLGITELAAGASAVAGPSAPLARLCNLLPIAVCGTPAEPNHGFVPGQVYVLKNRDKSKDGVEFGDFHLLRPDASQDSEDGLRRNFAGGFGSCVLIDNEGPTTPTIRIKPGSNIGPVAQGINTRFNVHVPAGQLDPAKFPPDVLIGEPSPALKVDTDGNVVQGGNPVSLGSQITGRNRTDYLARLAQGSASYDIPPLPAAGGGALLRREVAVPIADCSPPINENALPIVGAGCFFLLQKMASGAKESTLLGEFIPDCEAAGRPGPNPGTGGPYVIQLFRDFSGRDS